MGELFFPFDEGAGANVTEANWRKMAELWRPSGVIPGELNKLEAYADSSGMQVKVKTGKGWIKGHYYELDAEKVLAIAANATGAARLDRVILRADFTTNTIAAVILQGTAALPALTQTSATWEIALATITVPNGAATIAAGAVTDTRLWSISTNNPPSAIVKKSVGQTLTTGVAANASWNLEDEDNDAIHDLVTLNDRLTCKTPGLYAVWCSIKWATDTSVGFRQVDLIHNGATILVTSMVPGGSNVRGAGNTLYVEKRLAIGDYITLNAWHDRGADLDISILSRCGMRWVGA